MPMFALSLLALVVAVTVYALTVLRAPRLADRRRILSEGCVGAGSVVAIAAPDRAGQCRVRMSFTAGGRVVSVVQQASTAAVAALALAPGVPLEIRYRRDRPRLAFAPALVLAEYVPRPVLAPATTSGPVLYVVDFEDPEQRSLQRPANAFGWTGGELLVDQASLQVRAQRARPFRRPVLAQRTFPLQAIQNVEVHANLLTLELVVDGRPYALRLWSADAATATDLANRLPGTRSEAFVPAMAEASAFHRQLLTMTPTTPVTIALVALNLLAFAVAAWLGAGWLKPDAARLVMLGANYTPLTQGGQFWRLMSNTFLHFGVLHVGFNMWALLVNGPIAERLFGSTRYLLIYLVAGIGASLTSLWWHPLVNSAGASGAIFGVFGATLAFFVRAPDGVPASVAKSHRNSILLFIALTLLLGLQAKFIDHAAHLGGLLVGFGLGYGLARPLYAARASAQREHQHALGLALAAAALALVAVLGGPTTEAISATVAGGVPGVAPHPTLTSFAGIRLGATRAELRAARGKPAVEHRDTWRYDIGEFGHPAVLEVTFHVSGTAASPADRVGAVLYRGDKPHAPSGLLYVTGQARAQFATDFGQPVWLLHAKEGIDYAMYADGLTVEFERDRARAYGLQDYYRTLHD